jgi:signal transduction histidine kinase
MGGRFHLENAINNLLDNAIKYGGSFDVSAGIEIK